MLGLESTAASLSTSHEHHFLWLSCYLPLFSHCHAYLAVSRQWTWHHAVSRVMFSGQKDASLTYDILSMMALGLCRYLMSVSDQEGSHKHNVRFKGHLVLARK